MGKTERTVFLTLLAVAGATVAAYVAWVVINRPQPLQLPEFNMEYVYKTLMALFVVTLIVERATEVIISIWREPGKVRQEAADLAEYKAQTGRVAGMLLVLMGVLAATLGVRILQPLVDPGSLQAAGPFQRGAFHVYDVIVTGAFIGGGSAAQHQLIETIVSAFKKLRKILDQ